MSGSVAGDAPTVLVVDDTRENLAVLGHLLRGQYRVRVANSGQHALRAANSDPRPDLILLDVMMPEMDGFQVLGELRATAACRDIPVIFVTALDGAEDEARGLELGAVDYITKPVRPAIVRARVATQLELKRARDRMRDQNTWLEQEVQRRVAENQVLQETSLRALASLAETRDNETGNHILRTQSYVELLCRQLARGRHAAALTEEVIDAITKAAPLHDIGKVGIPDHILLKKGRFDAGEWAIMRGHARLGADAIRKAIRSASTGAETPAFRLLTAGIEIAEHHHEKWDGSGYPDGLRGEQIPLSARVMAVADVFDALICRRVYKEAMGFEVARDLIVEGRGHHFDPEIVDAFLLRFEDCCAIARCYADEPGETP
jgi:putative two-component system response regulator